MKPSTQAILAALLTAFLLVCAPCCSRLPEPVKSAVTDNGEASDSTASNGPQTPADTTASTVTRFYTYETIHTYPHNRDAFTQGLVFADSVLYEGTGINGSSSLRKVELKTGNILQIHALPPQVFGEGIAIVGDRIVQLTWQSGVAFVYAKDSFALQRQFSYTAEGWGLTYDGAYLIMSDGSPTLVYRDPQTFEEVGRIEVTDSNGPVSRLNELEYVKGEIYANVWQTDYIARISPQTGRVLGWINLRGLLSAEDRKLPVDVLNGIAYDPAGDRLFVTGKWWPRLFEIKLIPNP